MKRLRPLCACLSVLLSACGGGGGDAPPILAAQSTRQVTYDDCFPAYNDVVVGDNSSSRTETVVNGSIYTYDNVTTVLSVTPTTFNGRAAVSIDTDTPPTTVSGPPVVTPVSGVRVTSLALRGDSFTQLSRTYFTAGNYNTTTTNAPTQLGDLTIDHTVSSFNVGDNITDAFSTSSTYAGSTVNANYSMQIKFMGVEEGTSVIGGTFPYTCIFRYTLFDASNTLVGYSDTYIHKWGVAKTISYSNAYPRPLVSQMIADTGYDRRKAAGN